MRKRVQPIRVLVVEDSMTARELLLGILKTDADIEVVGTVSSGEDAVRSAQTLRPDVITMDVILPGMDGFEATRQIMQTAPTRIIIVTATPVDVNAREDFRVLEAGALTVLVKPTPPGHPKHAELATELLQMIRAMAGVQVVKRWAGQRAPEPLAAPVLPFNTGIKPRIVAIGASTGGPLTLKCLLENLPKPFPLPILIVQHIAEGFTQGFCDWLGQACGMPVYMAHHGQRIAAGAAYVAPWDMQMRVTPLGLIDLVDAPREYCVRPSASFMFRAVAQVYGAAAVGVLLTGMGRDGAKELRIMREAGAVTFAQDKQSSVIFGMPGEAVKLDAAVYIQPPEVIAMTIGQLVERLPAQPLPSVGQTRR